MLTKVRDNDDDAELFKAKLNLSRAFAVFTLVLHGDKLPIEKVRDETARISILYSAAPFCLNEET